MKPPNWEVLRWGVNVTPPSAFSVCFPKLVPGPLFQEHLVTSVRCWEDPFLPSFGFWVLKSEEERGLQATQQEKSWEISQVRFLSL